MFVSGQSVRRAARRTLLAACVVVWVCAASATASETRVVDVDVNGNPAVMNTHQRMALSADGRYVAFTAFSSNGSPLVSGVDPAPYRVYLRDMLLGTTILVSKTSTGSVPGASSSFVGSISSDGRYVVFSSFATLTPNAPGGGVEAAYLFDRLTDAVELVSLSNGGVGSQGSFSEYSRSHLVTPDGRYVLFESTDSLTNDAGPSTSIRRVYRRDRVGQTTLLISETPGGASPPHSYAGGITADGSRMLYQSVGTVGSAPTPGVYVREPTLGLTHRIDVDTNSLPLLGVPGTSLDWTSDGARVVVASAAQNVTIGDSDAAPDIYVIDWTIGAVAVVSKQQSGQHTTAGCTEPTISDDGRYVAFESLGVDVVPWDQNQTAVDIVLRDLVTQRNAIQNVSNSGSQSAGGDCFDPVLSGDGRVVVFASLASGLAPGVTGPHYYHRDRIGFTNLGYGKPGSSHSAPQLNGSGSTDPGGSGTLFLNNGKPFSNALLFVAIDRSYFAASSGPFKGTVLVTAAPIFALTIPVDAFGQFFVPYTLPSNLPFVPEIYLQCAIPDPLAINGVSVSSGLLMGM